METVSFFKVISNIKTMKKILFLFVMLSVFLTGCEKEQEFSEVSTVVIASKKLDAIVSSCGIESKIPVYAVKQSSSAQWSACSDQINNFDYKEGYEYVVKLGKKNFHDKNMSVTSWSEYYLVELVSKEKKESEGLPETFIPDSWTEKE